MAVIISGTTGISTPDGSASVPPLVGTTSSTAGVLYPAANTVALSTNSTERFRVDSTGKIWQTVNSTTTANYIGWGDATTTYGQIGGYYDSSTTGHLEFYTFSTTLQERMRIDNAGKVGIGTSTPSAMLQVAGSSSIAAAKVPNILETATVSATAATGTINYDVTTQSVLYYTSSAGGNWTVNFRGSSGTSLDTLMATNDVVTVVFLVTQGLTPYYNSAITIDGNVVTPKYQGGTAWTAGNAASVDAYTYTIIKTASATFTVLASQTQFK